MEARVLCWRFLFDKRLESNFLEEFDEAFTIDLGIEKVTISL